MSPDFWVARERRVFFHTTVNGFTVNVVTKRLVSAEAGQAAEARRRDMKAQRILMVDDDRDLVASVKAFLEARGYAVDTAYSGIEAREQLKKRRPDLVVLDIMMDYDTDGFNVAYKLRDEPETARIPVIIMSGFTKELETKTHIFEPMMYREWPAAKFFEKPVKLSALAEAIAGLLAGDEVPAAAKEA
jgi:DNA-binding response OmpR family regulator